ncbi:hypothetical protein RJ639_028366 [Escallonia herrerae]|uniref:ELMO domain-containing protein n=1 Tax=Escallonia herrerae TaxID=1293975 RepID=A0AA89BF83_9ASTE|nr:hypothetical protein RJ639_028366 [Escallonia herrerae]
MRSSTLRRRLHHVDVDETKHEHLESSVLDDLTEPLLENNQLDETCSTEGYGIGRHWDDEQRKELLHWTLLFSHLIAQWAQWIAIANIIVGPGSFVGQLLHLPSATRSLPPSLSPLQEARLKNLQRRLEVPFDGSHLEHQDALRQLWMLAYPDRELPSLKSKLWKEMGWQGPDPSTDFRGGGLISLENLIYFAKMYPDQFQKLLHKTDEKELNGSIHLL